MNLPKKIKKLRKERNWLQADLAKKLDIHTSHVSRLETGDYAPSLKLLLKLSEVFEVSVDFLVKDEIDSFEIHIQDKSLAEKIRLVDSLGEEERQALAMIIDAMLTKKKMFDLLTAGELVKKE